MAAPDTGVEQKRRVVWRVFGSFIFSNYFKFRRKAVINHCDFFGRSVEDFYQVFFGVLGNRDDFFGFFDGCFDR